MMTDTDRQTFDALCASAGLTAEWTSAEGHHRDESGWEHHAFRFTFAVRGETIAANVPYRQGLAFDADPTESDLLAAVLMDAGTAAPYRGVPFDEAWLDSADEMGMIDGTVERLKRAREAFRTCRAWDDLLRERLGDDTTDALIAAAQSL